MHIDFYKYSICVLVLHPIIFNRLNIIIMFFPVLFFFILFLFYRIDANEYLSSSSNETCTVKYGKRLLNEGEEILINRKLYIVEDCHLQRAYQACGSHLWYMIDIVCEALDLHGKNDIRRDRIRRFTQIKLLSEACCLTACTIVEMTRYCP
jgi:hypothetical protein